MSSQFAVGVITQSQNSEDGKEVEDVKEVEELTVGWALLPVFPWLGTNTRDGQECPSYRATDLRSLMGRRVQRVASSRFPVGVIQQSSNSEDGKEVEDVEGVNASRLSVARVLRGQETRACEGGKEGEDAEDVEELTVGWALLPDCIDSVRNRRRAGVPILQGYGSKSDDGSKGPKKSKSCRFSVVNYPLSIVHFLSLKTLSDL